MHELPDGQSISVREEGQQLGEALIRPSLLGLDLPDLPSVVVTQIMQHPDGPTRKVIRCCSVGLPNNRDTAAYFTALHIPDGTMRRSCTILMVQYTRYLAAAVLRYLVARTLYTVQSLLSPNPHVGVLSFHCVDFVPCLVFVIFHMQRHIL